MSISDSLNQTSSIPHEDSPSSSRSRSPVSILPYVCSRATSPIMPDLGDSDAQSQPEPQKVLLREFNVANPGLWFMPAEREFDLFHVSDQNTRFTCLLRTLPHLCWEAIQSIVERSGPNAAEDTRIKDPYTVAKTFLMSTYGDTEKTDRKIRERLQWHRAHCKLQYNNIIISCTIKRFKKKNYYCAKNLIQVSKININWRTI